MMNEYRSLRVTDGLGVAGFSFRALVPTVFKAKSKRRDTLPIGSVLGDQFKIKSFLGEGGFGFTYKAVDRDANIVAIKECFPKNLVFRNGDQMGLKSATFSEEVASIMKQFESEAYALRHMDHSNIVRGGQLLQANGTVYLLMDYVKGKHLGDARRSFRWATQMARAHDATLKLLSSLEHIHAQGFLHNDISPENIIVTGDDEPVMIDFGTCTRMLGPDEVEDDAALLVVKPGYSPPEFYCSAPKKTRQSDIYQLGATLYHMLTRTPPPESMLRLSQIARKGQDPMRNLLNRLGPDHNRLLESVEAATAYRAGDRFATAEEWRRYIEG